MDIITPFLMQSAVQAITPILLAALAGVLCGRVGVFNMALEGQMLIGAFAAVVGSYYLGSALGGVVVAMIAVVIFSLILAYGATVFRGDPVVICIGMNLLASGLTAYLLRQMFGVSGTFTDPAIVGLDKIRIAAAAGDSGPRLGFWAADDPDLARLVPGRSRSRSSSSGQRSAFASAASASSRMRPRRSASTCATIAWSRCSSRARSAGSPGRSFRSALSTSSPRT